MCLLTVLHDNINQKKPHMHEYVNLHIKWNNQWAKQQQYNIKRLLQHGALPLYLSTECHCMRKVRIKRSLDVI